MGQHITIAGNVGGEPERKRTTTDKSMLRFSVAKTERRQDAQGAWVDGATSWYRVVAYDRLADNAGASLRRGEPVVVVGDLTVNEWTASDGQTRREAQVKAVSIGHDLSRGTAVFTRAARQGAASAAAPAAAVVDRPAPVPPVDRSGQWAAPMSGEERDPQPPSPPRLALVPDGVDEVPF